MDKRKTFLGKVFLLFTNFIETRRQKRGKDAQKSHHAVHTQENHAPDSAFQQKRIKILANILYAKNQKP